MKGQWVFGGVERGSGKTFLVAVHYRTAETFVAGYCQAQLSSVTAGCQAGLSKEGFKHMTVNHSLCFIDPTGAHTNTIDSTWKHVKATLSPYNRQSDYVVYLSEYMFRQKCKSKTIYPFVAFMDIEALIGA